MIYAMLGLVHDIELGFRTTSHWVESLEDPDAKIWRPRQVYVGETKRSYVPLSSRDEKSQDKVLTEINSVCFKAL